MAKINKNLFESLLFNNISNRVEIKWIVNLTHPKPASKLLLPTSSPPTPKSRRKSPLPGKTESPMKTTNNWEMFSFSSTKMEVASSTLKKSSRFLKKSVSTREIPTSSKLFGPSDKPIRIWLSKSSLMWFAPKSENTEQETACKECGSFTTRKTQEWSDLSS